jgi:DNA-binding MarR family transcriptional regulator
MIEPGQLGIVSPEQLGERYLTVHHRIRRVVDDCMAVCGLTLARTKILVQLERRGPTRQSVLATEFGVAPHTITDIVDALERDGLVARQPDSTDRRAKLVALTGRGETALAAAASTRERLVKQIFGGLDPADRATLIRLLGALDDAAAAIAACPPQARTTPPDLMMPLDLTRPPDLTAPPVTAPPVTAPPVTAPPVTTTPVPTTPPDLST